MFGHPLNVHRSEMAAQNGRAVEQAAQGDGGLLRIDRTDFARVDPLFQNLAHFADHFFVMLAV